jgi:hypothetical protein
MTTWNVFIAVASALVVRDVIARIISEVSYYLHVKKHGSILDRLDWDEDKDID